VHISFRVAQIFAILYLTAGCCIVCVLFGIIYSHVTIERNTQERRVNILQAVKTIPFTNLIFREGADCVICLSTFNENDPIVQLKCHATHIYHQKCIEDWIERGTPQCPLCKVPIDF